MNRELDIPPDALDAEDGFEILRVWAGGGAQHVTIRSSLVGGPVDFGYMLAHLCQHGANLYSQREERNRDEVLGEIRRGFDEQLHDNETSYTGGIGDKEAT